MMASVPRDTITSIIMGPDNTCLCKIFDGYVFLVSSGAHSSETWKLQATKDIKAVIGMDPPPLQMYRLFKIAIPISEHHFNYILCIYFKTTLNAEQKRKAVVPNGYTWLTYNNLQTYYIRNSLSSPMFLELFPKLRATPLNYESYADQFVQFGCIIEVTSSCMFTRSNSNADVLIDSANLKSSHMFLYKDFFGTCSPNALMSFYHFNLMMNKFGLTGTIVTQIFRAADNTSLGFITYRDFVCVVALLDPMTVHEGIAAQARKTFLFRMFDTDGDDYLSREELEGLLTMVRANNDPELRQCIVTMKMNTAGKKLSSNEYMNFMNILNLKGLASCLRAPKSIQKVYYNVERGTESHRNSNFSKLQSMTFQSKQEKTYSIASHTLKIVQSGHVINVENIWGLKDVCSGNTLQEAGITRELRPLSCEINSASVLYNEQIRNLRLLTYVNNVASGNRGNSLADFNWGTISDSLYGNRLIEVCKRVKSLVSGEKRLVELKSPVYILGSIHGNYGDLLYFEKMLWPHSPGFCPAAILFLGNYIDRTPFGIEVISYLFCYKILYPAKLILLRGSHEHRKIQQKECFVNECIKKFGMILGREVWQAVNEVFDCLPIAATIDDKILCLHSGIPSPNACTLAKAINNIPNPLIDPEKSSPIAWEIFWNEPLKRGDDKPGGDTGQGVDGFAKNLKRGTGYTFSMIALNKFLDTNFYSHLIRSNETVPIGYTFANKGRLITVFSSSRYNNQTNDAACLLADGGKIRAICLGV